MHHSKIPKLHAYRSILYLFWFNHILFWSFIRIVIVIETRIEIEINICLFKQEFVQCLIFTNCKTVYNNPIWHEMMYKHPLDHLNHFHLKGNIKIIYIFFDAQQFQAMFGNILIRIHYVTTADVEQCKKYNQWSHLALCLYWSH